MTEAAIASYVVLWAIVILQGVLLLGALRHLGLVQLRLGSEPGALITDEGLERGFVAPAFQAVDVLNGEIRSLADYRGDRLALIFLSPTCQSCKQLIPHVNSVAADRRGDTRFLVVCNGTQRACREFTRAFQIAPPVISDPDRRISSLFESRSTPFAFLINEEGRVLFRGIVNDWMQLDSLLEEQGTYMPFPTAEPEDHAQPAATIGGMK